ncbi:hypothetical protein [Mycolicibacterium goodii]|uniref:Uncharacterized protein n=1 Tax=Mycolicibacterium goodii TaxID=134601 RepID=A0ABS6HNA2_MYCGD|nr:hypothetical protein [Mycolicibacterium goodii]MBU8824176.1 hypothetical protein [Mycolicibacterium goodii]MBU8838040.1 hypothetical protein [Mycolicibacterium goodii]
MTEPRHTAAAYEIVLSVRGKPTDTLPLDNFDGEGAKFSRFFASFIKSMPTDRLVEDATRSYGEPSSIIMAGNTYSCRLISGTSGIASKFRARGTTPGFTRTPDDVEEMSFGVYLLEPPNAKVGFLIIERIGGRTLARAFRTKLTEHFRAIYPGILLTLARTAQTDAWRQAEQKGKEVAVRQIIAIHRGIEAGQMDQFGIGGGAKKVGEYHQILRFNNEPETANVLKKVRNHFYPPNTGLTAHGGTISLSAADDGGADEDEHDEASELIAEVQYKGQPPQKIRVSGARPPAIKYPIDVGAGGDTDGSAFRSAARDIAKNLAGDTDCRLDTGWDTGEWPDADSLPHWEVTGFG